MFRREWRQQLLVLTLLTVAVTAAIGSITIAYNSVPADNSDFGSANKCSLDGSDPQELQAALDSAKNVFGTFDVIGHRSVSVPAASRRWITGRRPRRHLHRRAARAPKRQLPGGAPRGRRHRRGGGVSAARDRIDLALDGRRRTVVGIVENPSKLSDEFALVPPSSASPEVVDLLVDASEAEHMTPSCGPRRPLRSAYSGSMLKGNDVSETTETLAMFSVATVFLLLASLVAAAGFAVVAQRRLRQLGMLAVGATGKHLRLVMLTNGAVVGTLAAVIGTIAGLGLWLVFAPTLESAVDHRIDRLSLPGF